MEMNKGSFRLASEEAGVAKLGPETPAAKKRFNYTVAGVVTVILIVVAMVVIMKFHGSAYGAPSDSSKAAQAADKAEASKVQTIRVINVTPIPVRQEVTTNWFEIRGDVDSLAKNIRPVHRGYRWDMMLNDDPTQVIHMPALGEAERHVTIKNVPTSVRIRIVPLQASTKAGLMAWDLIPN